MRAVKRALAAAWIVCAPATVRAGGAARYPYASPTFAAQRMSCEHGDARACVEAAGQFAWSVDQDRAPLSAQQLHDRAALYARGCELGAQDGCVQLAKALAAGDGVPKDEARARTLADAACKGHEPEGCVVSSWLAQDPVETKPPRKKAPSTKSEKEKEGRAKVKRKD